VCATSDCLSSWQPILMKLMVLWTSSCEISYLVVDNNNNNNNK